MPSNFTENYNLSQWERTDKVQMEDFNEDNAKIDEALKAEADARAALQTALAKKGNCSISLFSYTGNGQYGSNNPTRITFPRMPAAYFVIGDSFLAGRGGASSAFLIFRANSSTANQSTSVTWSGSTLSIYSNDASAQMNSVISYTVLALYLES